MIDMILNSEINFWNILIFILSSCAVIFFTLPVHEAAHAYTAVKLGDPTPRYQGRLTLNPFAHIDYLGALLIVLFGFGYAKPVNINARNFNNPKWGMALTALAGPISNILMAFVAHFLLNLLYILPFSGVFVGYVLLFLSFIIQINISLAVFNLISIPPLDGSRLLVAFLPDRLYYRLMQYERYLFYLVLALCATDSLGGPIAFLSDKIYDLISTIAALPFHLFM